MRKLLIAIAKFLHLIGLARRVHHVEAGARVHLTAAVLDITTASPVADAEVAIERPAEATEATPAATPVGRTDSDGNIDETALVLWSYDTPSVTPPLPPAPPMHVLITKAGFRVQRVPFALGALPSVDQVYQLPLGTLGVTRAREWARDMEVG
jgi:hypothetical protein